MSLESALQSFSTQPLLAACRSLFKDTLNIPLSPLADSPITPQRFFRDAYKPERHDSMENLFLVGRITDDSFHAATQAAADLDTAVTQAAADDYNGMFLIAADLGTRELTRSDLAARTRDINRTFSAPVIVVFRHGSPDIPVWTSSTKAQTKISAPRLSIGVASRRPHKRDKGKDVLGKVSMIREINVQTPHRGHLDILKDFSFTELEKHQGKGKRGHKIDSYKSFHAALEQIFNTELLNERFYKELANWYFWALPQVEFPADLEPDDEKRRATGLIRLITRLIFCWFLKEKDGLVPEKLFNPAELKSILKGFDPESETSSTYYQAILQNLFFGTLNQRMGKDSKGNPYRVFATDEGYPKNRVTYDVNNLYRYEKLFAVPQDEAIALFADIPFLNGGLFECLDRTEDGTNKKLYLDGFSRNTKKRPHVPDRLFFDSGETADLSNAYGDKKRKKEPVTGLISILNRYKFTIVENTPIDQEIALDPELLGKVFENLLASYNEETKTTARKQTGSFYTPRPIVDYMVDESIKAYLARKVEQTFLSAQSPKESQTGMSVLPITKTRRKLPHWKKEGATYWITFRMADSLPQEKLKSWKAERDIWTKQHPEPWDDATWKEYDERFGDRLDQWLDAGMGSCALARPEIREAVKSCLLKFDGQRLIVHSAVIMPNHVHALIEPLNGHDLSKLLQGIKGASAREANRLLGLTGTFWLDESYDHIVRSEAQYKHFLRYIAENPIKAKLRDSDYWLLEGSADMPVCDSEGSADILVCDSSAINTDRNVRATLDHLFTYNDDPPEFTPAEVTTLIAAIDALKVLDPACGSGAFPMGVLHKLVHLLTKLDPDNARWKQTQLAKLDSAPMRDELERTFEENNDDYGRKLYLIENCLYGVDIQPIAIQITKLRFFISLICDQKTNRNKKDNHGIRPLPNLETKFVAADTLSRLPELEQMALAPKRAYDIEAEIENLYHNHFSEQNRIKKLTNQRKVKELRHELAQVLSESLMAPKKAQHIADWDPFDPQTSADFFDPHWMFGRSLKDGFDIVIGNPPYISVEKFARTKQQEFWRSTYKTFAARGDIYCFFYERGLSLLKQGGILSYITSNKFQKAGYGKALRQLLVRQQIEILVDFCELPVFEAATDPIIVILANDSPVAAHEFTALVVKDEKEFGALSVSVATRGSRYKPAQLKSEGWSLEGADDVELVTKLRSKGTPLVRYVSGRLYRGIITGLNEAFVIDKTTRDQLIQKDSRSSELIKPWIRGKDIKRWHHEYHDLYVIIVRFGFNTELHNYPAIQQHLGNFEEKLRARGQCKTSRSGSGEGQHHWLELDNNPSIDYIAAFDEPKIVFNETSKRLHAYIDTEQNAINKTGFIILIPEASYVLTVLNSTAMDWLYRSTFPAWGDVWNAGRVQFRGNLMNQVPIPAANAADKAKLSNLAERAAKAAVAGDTDGVTLIERDIDEIVYRLFDLTAAEISQIETALANTRSSISIEEADDDE